jgi:uncharacterized protein (DUF1015 family)
VATRPAIGYRGAVVQIRPFSALRPPTALAERVASPPYDVVSSREARALAAGNDESFLRVSRPEVGLPESTDEHDDAVYLEGRRALESMVAKGVLTASEKPSLWLYAQQMGSHRQVGLVACASVDEYDSGLIKKHEKTRPDKEDDRTRHIDEMGAHDEPVFLTYRKCAAIDVLVAAAQRRAPLDDFSTSDGVRHTVWGLDDAEVAGLVARFASDVPCLYVADGHHRSAAASRVHAKRAGEPGEHGAFLAVVFPHDQMQILPYNRLVRDDRGRSPGALLEELQRRFEVVAAPRPEPPSARTLGLLVGGQWYWAAVRAGSFDEADPVASLDCSLCQDQLLAPVFGITDPRTDRRVDFVGGIRGAGELERRASAEGWNLGICLFPTQIEQLLAVSDAGLLMPPKSTWFEPKLRSGLFVHPFGY